MSASFIALMLLDALLLWAVIASKRGWWAAKLAAIVVVVAFNFLTLHAYSSGDGWPTGGFPRQAQFIQCLVVQPVPGSSYKGAIYLWVVVPAQQRPLIGYHSAPGAPRAYVAPYSEQLYAQCRAASKAASRGQQVMVGRGHGRRGNGGTSRGRYIFYHLPPAVLPRKARP